MFGRQIRGLLGEEKGVGKANRIANRVARVDEAGVHCEAGPRHAELIIAALGLTSAHARAAPGVKASFEALRAHLNQYEPREDAEAPSGVYGPSIPGHPEAACAVIRNGILLDGDSQRGGIKSVRPKFWFTLEVEPIGVPARAPTCMKHASTVVLQYVGPRRD